MDGGVQLVCVSARACVLSLEATPPRCRRMQHEALSVVLNLQQAMVLQKEGTDVCCRFLTE